MRYLGGKARLAKHLVPLMPLEGREVWEPFFGGGNMSVHLAPRCKDLVCSDAHPALAPMFRALQAGWDPPETLSEDEYRAAKLLPDSDPLKAFAGFGCSFGGKYFGGYARCNRGDDYCGAARNQLLKHLRVLTNAHFFTWDFLIIDPGTPDLIYCDPPYASTTKYSQESFDHAAFWDRCVMWANRGVPVFVSEYTCPVKCVTLYSKVRDRGLRGVETGPARKVGLGVAPVTGVVGLPFGLACE